MHSCHLAEVRLLPKRFNMGGSNNEQDAPMASVANIGRHSLPGSLCADADTRKGSHPNTHCYVAVHPSAHCYVAVHLNAHCYVTVHLTATFANTHGNAYTAASSPTRHTYPCPPRPV